MNDSYQEHVLEHYRLAYHKTPEVCEFQGTSVSRVCGDGVTIQAGILDGVITEIWWQGEGCCFSESAASMLVQFAEGETVERMKSFTDEEMLLLFQADCPKLRVGCVLVAVRALRKLLEMYDAK